MLHYPFLSLDPNPIDPDRIHIDHFPCSLNKNTPAICMTDHFIYGFADNSRPQVSLSLLFIITNTKQRVNTIRFHMTFTKEPEAISVSTILSMVIEQGIPFYL